jgi:hypothetical protein
MQARSTGSHHYAVDPVFQDSLFNFLLAGIGTGIAIPHRDGHIRQCLSVFPDLFSIHRTGDIQSAVADKHPDPDFLINHVYNFLPSAFSFSTSLRASKPPEAIYLPLQ